MFKKMYKFVVDMNFFVVLWFDGRVVFGSSVSRFSQHRYILWYKQMSLVMLFVLLVPYHGT